MQDLAQRRAASLQYYREQYDSAHPHGPSPSSSSSSLARHAGNRYTVGEDEIDGGIVHADIDEVDTVDKCLTRAKIMPSTDDIWVAPMDQLAINARYSRLLCFVVYNYVGIRFSLHVYLRHWVQHVIINHYLHTSHEVAALHQGAPG